MLKQYTIPIFVPHLGCTYDCVFCNQTKITGKSTTASAKDARATIEEYLGYFDQEIRLELGFFGGSFTGIDPQVQEELLQVAYDYKSQGKIQAIRLSTRPDFIDQATIDRLKKYQVDIVELGVQSMDQDVLNKSGRGHGLEDVYRSVELLKSNNIGLGLQMMVGLPGDTIEKSRFTVEEFIRLEPACVRIYPTLVVRDTQLEKMYLRAKYFPMDLNTSIDGIADFLMMFELAGINVIRIGLQATENMQLGRDIVAGPFHPSYGQFVQSRIYLKILQDFLDDLDLGDHLVIRSDKKNISSIVGQKASNKKHLIDRYNLKKLVFIGEDMGGKDLVLDYRDQSRQLSYMESIKNYLNK